MCINEKLFEAKTFPRLLKKIEILVPGRWVFLCASPPPSSQFVPALIFGEKKVGFNFFYKIISKDNKCIVFR